MKRAKMMGIITVLYAVIIMALPTPYAEADVQVTVSFAAGGVACGIYFFFYLSSGLAGDMQPEAAALFNHGPDGWQIRPPFLQFQEDHERRYTPYADIIRIRF